MKALSLKIRNVGMIGEATIEFNKPLLILYGEIRQGKTTALNSLKWVLGAPFPQDIIKHGCRDASITFAFEGGSITREWYIAKDQTTKGKPIVFVRDGKPVSNPVKEIEKFLNPFLLDQDYLRNMTELERKRYFTEIFAVKTDDLDSELIKGEGDARELRAKIKGYGDLDVTPVERINVDGLRKKLADIRAADEEAVAEVRYTNAEIDKETLAIAAIERARDYVAIEVRELEKRLIVLKKELDGHINDLAGRHRESLADLPSPTDTSAIESQISQAAAQDVRYEQYQKNLAASERRKADEKKLLDIENRAREIKSEKVSRLKGISDSTGIEGLEFDDTGNFIFEGTAPGMLSTSQLMRLSSALSDKYPEGFSISLLDRGESLGRSIFDYIERAKAKNATYLAAVVGERPAAVPAEVGVFVVKDGVVILDGDIA